MIDLSAYKCPWCENTNGNSAEDGYAECPKCGRAINGEEDTSKSAAAAWIELSEKIYGKPHDRTMMMVRIAVGVGPGGGVNCSMNMQWLKEDMPKGSAFSWVTATIPVPVAQEVKGRVEG